MPKAKPRTQAKTSTQEPDVHTLSQSDPHAWVQQFGITNTADVPLPELLIDEVIGQDEAVAVAKKAARQRRHLLLLGDPGTGKSMIAKAMAQILPPTNLDEVVVERNPKDANLPIIKVLKGGEGRQFMAVASKTARRRVLFNNIFVGVITTMLIGAGVYSLFAIGGFNAILLMLLSALVAVFFIFASKNMGQKAKEYIPNLLLEHAADRVPAPYVDATGSHHGSLLGDVRHDPFQSGGLETPTHLRVEPGAIHRANKGLLFIDEINVLRIESQQALLTAMQDKRYAITGQSDKSAGAMVRTQPVPCDFILVAAGNMDVIAPTDHQHTGLHPALRSRIRGYGYEVYVRSIMEDTDANRMKLVRFIAQEVRRDGQIPHFSGDAVAEVLREAQRRSSHTGKLTLRLRELGGLVRTAGDMARDDNETEVTVSHVLKAKQMSMSLEYQVTRRGIEVTTAQEALITTGTTVGLATGCTAMGTGETGEPAGVVVPVEADATISSDRNKGTLYLGGGLDKTGIKDNLAAIVKRLRGSDMAGIDLHLQALMQQHDQGSHSLAAAAAVACVSALEDAPVRRDTVVIGALSVSGRVRGVDGITQMVEAAADLGYRRAIVPASNRNDILLEHRYRDTIELVYATTLAEVLDTILDISATRKVAIRRALERRPT